jgi:hypothetical protein
VKDGANVRSGFDFETHKVIQAQQFRHHERDIGHRLAVKDDASTDGFLRRFADGLKGLRRMGPIVLDGPVLTDKVCRLADGTMGRIALRRTDGRWVEVCVDA